MNQEYNSFHSLPIEERRKILKVLLNEARSILKDAGKPDLLNVFFNFWWWKSLKVDSKIKKIAQLEPELKIKGYSAFDLKQNLKPMMAGGVMTRRLAWLEMILNEMEAKLKEIYN